MKINHRLVSWRRQGPIEWPENRTPWIFPFKMGTASYRLRLQEATIVLRGLVEEETKGGKTLPDQEFNRRRGNRLYTWEIDRGEHNEQLRVVSEKKESCNAMNKEHSEEEWGCDELPGRDHSQKRCSLAQIKERRMWRVFLEKNRKLLQFYVDHPEVEKTQI